MTKYPFPKIDLHLHLDGSFRVETMYEREWKAVLLNLACLILDQRQ